jgi:hypothetical protein
MTDRLMKGLDSEKILYKNQHKKIERLVEANKLLKQELSEEEASVAAMLQGRV